MSRTPEEQDMYDEGYEKGKDNGYDEGYEAGKEEGKTIAFDEALKAVIWAVENLM